MISDDPSRGLTRRGLGMGAAALAGLSGCTARTRPARLIVTGVAGSGTDRLARMFARHATRLFGVSFEIENEDRGVGTVAARRLLQSRDPETLAFFQNGLMYTALWQPDRVDLSPFQWIGSVSADRRGLVTGPEVGIDRFADLFGRRSPLVVVSGPVGASGWFEARILAYLTRAPVRIVPGFSGAVRNLALLSGEAEATIGSLDTLTPVLDTPGSRVLLRLDRAPPDPVLTARGWNADLMAQFAQGPDAAPLLAAVDTHAQFGRPVAMAPGAPPALVKTWRDRFMAVLADPGFVEEASAGYHAVDPTEGTALTDALTRLLSVDRERTVQALGRAVAET